MALGGPEDDEREASGGPVGPDPPPPRGFCPPGAAVDEEHLLQESPQQRCSPPGEPFVALGDALGGPTGVADASRGPSASPVRVVDDDLLVGGGPTLPENVPSSYSRPPTL